MYMHTSDTQTQILPKQAHLIILGRVKVPEHTQNMGKYQYQKIIDI